MISDFPKIVYLESMHHYSINSSTIQNSSSKSFISGNGSEYHCQFIRRFEGSYSIVWLRHFPREISANPVSSNNDYGLPNTRIIY